MARRKTQGVAKVKSIEAPAAPVMGPAVITPQRVLCRFCRTADVQSTASKDGLRYYRCLRCVTDGRPTTFSVRVDWRLSQVVDRSFLRGFKRAVVFGCGNSARRFDFRSIDSEALTISVNDSWRLFHERYMVPVISFSSDQLFWKKIKGVQDFWIQKNTVVALDHDRTPTNVYKVSVCDVEGHWPEQMDDGVRWCQNSGLAAACLADCFGLERIELVGFDLDGSHITNDGQDRIEHHKLFLSHWEKVADLFRAEVVVHGESILGALFQ